MPHKSSPWMALNKIDKEKGLIRIYVEKEKVTYVGRTRIDSVGFTGIEYIDRWGNKKGALVLEEPLHIMNKISS